MPYYDYQCKDCGAAESVKATMAEREAGLVVECPACHSKNTEQAFTSVAVGSGAKSFAAPTGSCGGGCACYPEG